MKAKNLEKIELFNKRIDALYKQICEWLEEENIDFDKKESGLTLTEAPSGSYDSKRLDVFTKDNEKLFSIVPYGIWIIGAEGRAELEGDSGEESLVYLSAGGPSYIMKEIEGEKENIIRGKFNGLIKEGWHWVDEQIIGKKPLLTKEIFFALLERIN
ncbi:MAG: hypothetical protein PVH61_34535 [Candidatus Aminicenantes bacterium]|jgi:hypothetical protein